MASDGTATVAWSSIARTGAYPARVATAGSSLRFGAPQELAPSASVGDVAARPDRGAVVVWASLPQAGNNQSTEQVFTSARGPADAAFAAPESVSAAERAREPRVAVNPRTGRPAVVWIGRPGAPPVLSNQQPTGSEVLRFSERSG
jgi:hypothetical protein